jgi:N-acetylneuraminate synthase
MVQPAPYCYLIAEIGINHNGSLDIATQLIDMAAEAGCDAVKFQKRNIDHVYSQEELDKPRESPWGTTNREQKDGLEFGREEYDALDTYCREREIEWFGSAWDLDSLEFLSSYDPPHHKVASALVTSPEFVEAVADQGKHTYISTGMCEWDDIDRVVDLFRSKGTDFTLMHTVATYPMPDQDANLLAMLKMRERYECPIGFSSHEVGVVCSVAAATLGATAIERHNTLDPAMYGSDQAASLESRGLELLVRDVRLLPKIMGDGEKRMTEEEEPIARKLRYFATN